MALTIYDFQDELTNENEKEVMDLVYQYQVVGRLPCNCKDFLLDITALALSNLKPRYSVSILKNLHLTDDDISQMDSDVKKAVNHAINTVSARPKCSDDDCPILKILKK